MGDWNNYKQAKKDRSTLEPLKIDGEEFIFPAQPPADVGFNFLSADSTKVTPQLAQELIERVIGEERCQKLLSLTDMDEFLGILMDVVQAWGFWAEEKKGQLPNRQARRASKNTSSKGSARSKQTSGATTA